MRRTFTVIILLALLALGISPALAAGNGAARTNSAAFAYFSDPGVVLELHRVTVEIDNQVATTHIEQVFANRGERPAEGNYVFPLPVGPFRRNEGDGKAARQADLALLHPHGRP